MRTWLVAALLAAPRWGLEAQTPSADAAATITAQAMAEHIRGMGDDSVRAGITTGHGPDTTAQYIASQFRQLGLTPGGQAGSWFQHYQLPMRVDLARSQLVFTADSTTAVAKLSTAARLLKPGTPWSRPCRAVLVAGRQSVASLPVDQLRGRCALYLPPPVPDTASQQVLALLQRASAGVVVLNETGDSADFARRLQAEHPYLDQNDDWSQDRHKAWSAEVRPDAVPGLPNLLRAAGIILGRPWTDSTPTFRELSLLQLELRLQFAPIDADTASNVIGLLEGSDSSLKDQYVVFVAHMDATGTKPGQPGREGLDGGHDNASGTAGLLALAKAFSQPGARPARSVAFVATSGHAYGLGGSEAFASQAVSQAYNLAMQETFKEELKKNWQLSGCTNVIARPTPQGQVTMSCGGPEVAQTQIGVSSIITAVNLDHIGRAAGDSVVIDGLEDAKFEPSPAWIAASHPELQLAVIEGGTAATPGSEQFSFIRRSIPSLYFHDRIDRDPEHPSSGAAPQALDLERAARVIRLAFHVGTAIANAKQVPQWTDQGRLNILEHTDD